MPEEIKRMDIREFVEIGFLQEVNRQFFHPLGLALEVKSDDGINWSLSGVWDYRDDPEGIVYEPRSIIDIKKIQNVYGEHLRHVDARKKLMGTVIQEPEDA